MPAQGDLLKTHVVLRFINLASTITAPYAGFQTCLCGLIQRTASKGQEAIKPGEERAGQVLDLDFS